MPQLIKFGVILFNLFLLGPFLTMKKCFLLRKERVNFILNFFLGLGPGANVIKLFTAVIYKFS